MNKENLNINFEHVYTIDELKEWRNYNFLFQTNGLSHERTFEGEQLNDCYLKVEKVLEYVLFIEPVDIAINELRSFDISNDRELVKWLEKHTKIGEEMVKFAVFHFFYWWYDDERDANKDSLHISHNLYCERKPFAGSILLADIYLHMPSDSSWSVNPEIINIVRNIIKEYFDGYNTLY